MVFRQVISITVSVPALFPGFRVNNRLEGDKDPDSCQAISAKHSRFYCFCSASALNAKC
jgi:hypothetical protein